MKNFVKFENSMEENLSTLDKLARSTSLDFIFGDMEDIDLTDSDAELEEALMEDLNKNDKPAVENTSIYSINTTKEEVQVTPSVSVDAYNNYVRAEVEESSEEEIEYDDMSILNNYSSVLQFIPTNDEDADSDIEDIVLANSDSDEHVDISVEFTSISETIKADESSVEENTTIEVTTTNIVEEPVPEVQHVNDTKESEFEKSSPTVSIEVSTLRQPYTTPFESIRLSDGYSKLDIRHDIIIETGIESTKELTANLDADTVVSLINDLKLGLLSTRMPAAVMSHDQFITSFHSVNKIDITKYIFIKDGSDFIAVYKVDDSFFNIAKMYGTEITALNALIRMYELCSDDSLCFSPFFNDNISYVDNHAEKIINEIMYDKSTEFASSVTSNIDLFKVFNVIDFKAIIDELYSDIFNELEYINDKLDDDDEDKKFNDKFIDCIDDTLKDINDENDYEVDDDGEESYDEDNDIEEIDPHSNNFTNILQESLKTTSNSIDSMNIPVRRKNS